jgi:hypothetical protein
MKTIIRTFTAVLIAIGVMTATAGSASAFTLLNCIGPSPCKVIGSSGGENWGRMYADDELFSVQDAKKDGYSAVLQYGMTSSSNRATLWNNKGYGKTVHRDDDFPEGKQIKFRTCRGISSTKDIFGCGSWVYLNA